MTARNLPNEQYNRIIEAVPLSDLTQNNTSTVLLADDEWLLLWSLERLLIKQGMNVIKAPTGGAALALLKDHQVDWVISDFKLPDINGVEVLAEARRIQPGVKMALMTAYGSAEVESAARRLGAAYLPKPFKLEDIVELILSVEVLPH